MSERILDLPAESMAALLSGLQRSSVERSTPKTKIERPRQSTRSSPKIAIDPRRAGTEPRPVPVKACAKRGERQAVAAQLLFSGKLKNDVARDIGITSRTLRRWRKQKDFQRLSECQARPQNPDRSGGDRSKCKPLKQVTVPISVRYVQKSPGEQEELRRLAAMLIWEGELTDREIADQCGVTPRALRKWKAQSNFQRDLEQCRQAGMRASEAHGLVEFRSWIQPLYQRWDELWAIVTRRSQLPIMSGAGGRSGFLKPRVRRFGQPGEVTKICDFPIDRRTIREMRRIEERVSKRVGQWGRPVQPASENSTAATGPTWTRQQEQAALLVAQGELSSCKISSICKISPRKLRRWKQTAEFQARVVEHQQVWVSLSKELFVNKYVRVRSLQERIVRLEEIRLERANSKRLNTGIPDAAGDLQWQWIQTGSEIKTRYVPDEWILRALTKPSLRRSSANQIQPHR